MTENQAVSILHHLIDAVQRGMIFPIKSERDRVHFRLDGRNIYVGREHVFNPNVIVLSITTPVDENDIDPGFSEEVNITEYREISDQLIDLCNTDTFSRYIITQIQNLG